MTWQNSYQIAVKKGNLGAAIRALESQSTGHAGTPPAAVKQKAVELMLSLTPNQRLIDWAAELAGKPSPTAKELACSLIALLDYSQPSHLKGLLIQLADDQNWEVREAAAGLLASLLTRYFTQMYAICMQLANHPSPNVRRAVVVGVKYVAKDRNPTWAASLLGLLEPLLEDRDSYVRKNLGPFALGDGFLRYYPELTLKHLNRWAKASNEVILWNVAMCLSTAEARKHLKLVFPILRHLAKDDRIFVWRAVVVAIGKHLRSQPRAVKKLMRDFQRDPRLKHVVDAVEQRAHQKVNRSQPNSYR